MGKTTKITASRSFALVEPLLYEAEKIQNNCRRQGRGNNRTLQMDTEIEKHAFPPSALDHTGQFCREPVCQFLILETFLMAATAIPDDHVDVVWGNVPASDVAVIIALSVKGAYRPIRHESLIYVKPYGLKTRMGKKPSRL